ncbi:MAG: hypothetical protein EBT17_02085 [Actinobacteria bacterium]|nr:hypothetical protein [Actinomycetota bacterium]
MTDAQPLAAGVADAPANGIFRSLNFFNARLYFAGLLLSTIGSWVQLTATSSSVRPGLQRGIPVLADVGAWHLGGFVRRPF